MNAIQMGIIGASSRNLPKNLETRVSLLQSAEQLGRLIAKNNAILLTGGMDGVMQAASKGAFEEGGITIGTPGRERHQCNEFVTVEICTPIDVGDFVFAGVLSCDVIFVYPGGPGTLAEYALAYRFRKPMIIMRGFDPVYDELVGKKLDESSSRQPFYGADSPQEAYELAMKIIAR